MHGGARGAAPAGFRSAVEEVFPSTRAKRCRVHNSAGVAIDGFVEKYEVGCREAVACRAIVFQIMGCAEKK